MVDTGFVNISLSVVSLLVCIILFICVLASGYLKEKLTQIFIYILCSQKIVLLVDILIYAFNRSDESVAYYLLWVTVFLSFAFGIIIGWVFTWYFSRFLQTKTTVSKITSYAFRSIFVICGINMLFVILSLFNGMYFYINDVNTLVFGNTHLLSQILGLLVVVINAGIFIVHWKALSKREIAFLLSYAALLLIAFVTMNFLPGLRASYNVAITLTILVFYTGIQNDIINRYKQNELDARVSIMLTQIQPHFLYNALTAIAQLCDEDPVKAKKATIDFSTYLRGNMESLNDKGLIGIDTELKHVKGYLDLEGAIFGSSLSVIYDIEEVDFMLPTLSIQPIVENAVKHGIGNKEGGGVVTLSISHTDTDYVILVSDNGIGYDASKALEDKREHIGVKNVRQRLSEQCSGTLEITSEIGKGTSVIIRIPKV